MIEVFKTNVQKKSDANNIIAHLDRQFPDYKINFDLEDCDRIIRVEAYKLEAEHIIDYLNSPGFICIQLE